MKYSKEKDIAKAIEMTWDSLKSHLAECYEPTNPHLKEKLARDVHGGRNFHIKCVKEYAFIIKVLADRL